MCEREQKINKDEGGTPPFLHKTSTKKGRAFLKILEDKNKKKAPLLLVLLLSIDISSSTYYIVYSTKNGTGMVQVFYLVNSSIDVVGVQLGELLHNLHALVFVLLLRLQLVLALVPLQTRVVEQLRVQFLQHFTNVNGQTVHGGVPVRHRRPFQASEHDWDDHVSILCY